MGPGGAYSYPGNCWCSGNHNGPPYPQTWTFTFNTTVNTYGYDITSIIGLSMDPDGRSWQKYNLEYHTVGGGWTTVVTSEPSGYTVDRPGSGSSSWALVTLSDMGLSHVDQLRFTNWQTSDSPHDTGSTRWAEIDVIGAASIPEPATMALLGLGGLGLLLGRKRR